MVMQISRYNVYLINLDPTIGHEIKKTRPCLVVSPDEMNRNIQTVIIVPMTTKSHDFPTRVPVTFKGKKGWIVLDQIRTIDKKRALSHLGKINDNAVSKVKGVLKEMLVD
jgi:mRNA interferase MazF